MVGAERWDYETHRFYCAEYRGVKGKWYEYVLDRILMSMRYRK